MATIIETIDQLCTERGIKGSKLCDDLGISRSTLTELRKGRAKTLSVQKAKLIADYFGVTVEYLSGEQLKEETSFFDIFSALCKEKGISPNEAATEMGFSKDVVSVWKSKETFPQIEQLKKIATYFNVSTDYLLGKTRQKNIPTPQESEDDDIAIELEEMMQKLESDGTLMFDGNPASPEAILSIRTALEMGLRYARDVQKGKGQQNKDEKGKD